MKTRKIGALLLAVLFLLLAACQNARVKPAGGTPKSSVYEDEADSVPAGTDADETGDSAGTNTGTGHSQSSGPTGLVKTGETYETSGGMNIEELFLEETETSQVTRETAASTLDTPWDAFNYSGGYKGGSDQEADLLRTKILAAKNTAELYSWTGKTYYVSPDGNDENDGLSPQTALKTMDSDTFYSNPPQPGDAILFERGGVWRMKTGISTKEGVTYGSYGKGEKPTFYGSPYNYADKKFWLPSNKENVWKVTVADDDIGLVVFNQGEMVGYKRLNGITTLEKNGDYYFNEKGDTLYLYCDKGNPGKVFSDIELGLNKAAFGCGRDNVVIDNLRIKYYGRFGISMCGNNFTTITNCEIGFIGGALQNKTTGLRYGNGIQQWNSIDTLTIKNNWVYQVYDTGITWQGNDSYEPGTGPDGNPRTGSRAYYKNVTVADNLLEYNVYAGEFWHTTDGTETSMAQIANFRFENNIMRYSGYGWSFQQRPDKVGGPFHCGQHTNFINASNCAIKGNIFDCGAYYLVRWRFSKEKAKNFDIADNTFYFRMNELNGNAVEYGSAIKSAAGQAALEAAVVLFDPTYLKAVYLAG